MSNYNKDQASYPPRPDHGTRGDPVTLNVDHLSPPSPTGSFFDYLLAVTPNPTRGERRGVMHLAKSTSEWQRIEAQIAYEFHDRCIATQKLDDRVDIDVTYQGGAGGSKNFTIHLTYNKEIDWQQVVKYLSVHSGFRTLRQGPTLLLTNIIISSKGHTGGFKEDQNLYFFPLSDTSNLDGALEIVKGFLSDTKPTAEQVTAGDNLTTTAFYKAINLADAIRAAANAGVASDLVSGVNVDTNYREYQRKVKIYAITDKPANAVTFQCQEFGEVTVAEYFQKKYSITLRYPDMGVINISPPGKLERWIPPEVCTIIPGQQYHGQFTQAQRSRLTQAAGTIPRRNLQLGTPLLVLNNKDAVSTFKQFGFTPGTEVEKVPGRVLPSPRVDCAEQQAVEVRNGRWSAPDAKFTQGAELKNWVVLAVYDGKAEDFKAKDDPELVSAVCDFRVLCGAAGMVVENCNPAIHFVDITGLTGRSRLNRIEAELGLVSRSNPSIVFALLPEGDRSLYSGIKAFCDTKLDIQCDCAQSSKLRTKEYSWNIIRKINMKLGGVNHVLGSNSAEWLKEEVTMVMGANLMKQTNGDLKGAPSVVGVVGNVDDEFARYPASLGIQPADQHVIVELQEMTVQRLKAFQEARGTLPHRILFFRDGVSEGQYSTIHENEIPALQAAFNRIGGSTYRPRLSFIICAKGHNTRFTPATPSDGDAQGKTKQGTVVDRGSSVTSPFGFDFWLQSHANVAKKGAPRPTYYFVIHDENELKADVIQGTVNDMTFLFGKAQTSVSVVLPAYYAGLACIRGKCYLSGLGDISSLDSSEIPEKAKQVWGSGVGEKLGNNMFYL
jgi:hypothetical protein